MRYARNYNTIKIILKFKNVGFKIDKTTNLEIKDFVMQYSVQIGWDVLKKYC